jgi:hypothetical protein
MSCAGPINDSAGPINDSAGPINDSAGPINDSAGPINDSAGRTNEELKDDEDQLLESSWFQQSAQQPHPVNFVREIDETRDACNCYSPTYFNFDQQPTLPAAVGGSFSGDQLGLTSLASSWDRLPNPVNPVSTERNRDPLGYSHSHIGFQHALDRHHPSCEDYALSADCQQLCDQRLDQEEAMGHGLETSEAYVADDLIDLSTWTDDGSLFIDLLSTQDWNDFLLD